MNFLPIFINFKFPAGPPPPARTPLYATYRERGILLTAGTLILWIELLSWDTPVGLKQSRWSFVAPEFTAVVGF